MKKITIASVGLVGLLALSACVEDTGDMMQPDYNPLFPDVGFSPDVTNASVNACRNAVDAQTDGAVEVVGTEFSQANNVVYMRVGPQRAPWRCLVSPSGQIAEVMFVGSEGAA